MDIIKELLLKSTNKKKDSNARSFYWDCIVNLGYSSNSTIIKLFNNNVNNQSIILDNYNKLHKGKEGYWLEKKMGITHNSNNMPDIDGYEMKKDSKKITFGDFSATEYLFSKNKSTINDINGSIINISRTEFIRYFGTPNILKNNRYSWSGSCVPKYNNWNNYSILLILKIMISLFIIHIQKI